MSRWYVGVLVTFAIVVFLQAHSAAEEITRIPYQLGDTVVFVSIYENGQGQTYFVPHDNEYTASQSGRAFVASQGGRIIELEHSGRRNITFQFNGQEYAFDPNRMFTPVGIVRTLTEQSGVASQDAVVQVQHFAEFVLMHLMNPGFYTGTVVTLHNNTPGNYSVESYGENGRYRSDAEAVATTSSMDSDDFYFVTTMALYTELQNRGYNVVLQANDTVTDDGSFSVYCGQHGIAYVNVETEEGHYDAQMSMLGELVELLSLMPAF